MFLNYYEKVDIMLFKKKVAIVSLLLIFICTTLSTATYAVEPETPVNKNLVVNGNCEQGLSGWSNAGQWQIRDKAFMPKAVASASMYQDIPIDNLSVGTELQLNAIMYSFNQSPTDVGTLKLEILNSDKTKILVSQKVEHATATPTTKTISMLVPEEANFARVILEGRRRNGSDLNANFRNISLIPISKVPESQLKVVLEVSEQLQLSIDSDLSENTNGQWTSSNSEVAGVDINGLVNALTKGDARISVTYADGTTEYIDVLVVDDASDYRLAIDLRIGQTSRLTIDNYTFTKLVEWTSLDQNVATISNKGKVKAISEGLTVINAKNEQGNIVGQIYVRVRD